MVARKRRVRIHLVDGKSIDGLLVRNRKWLRLYDASYVESAERSIALDGHVEIPREKVLYLQEVGS